MKTVKVSATQARNDFFNILNSVMYEDTKVVVEKAGTNKTVIITSPPRFDEKYKEKRRAELKGLAGVLRDEDMTSATDRFDGEVGKKFLDSLRNQDVVSD